MGKLIERGPEVQMLLQIAVSQSKNRGKASRERAGVVDMVVFILLDEVQSKGL